MKTKLLYIERKSDGNVSIEKVFRQISRSVSRSRFEVSFQTLPYLNGTLGTIKNLLFFRKRKADIYHITGHNHYIGLLFPKEKTVLTVHDAGILRVKKGLRRYIIKKLNFDLPIKKLKYITAISETTKREIIAYTDCAPEKIRVIENPLQEHFIPKPNSEVKKFDADLPTILQIGTAPHKNLDNLILALENIRCRLVIIGKIDEGLKVKLEASRIRYENRYDLTDGEMRNEYSMTDIVVFCSTFEGFGLPIIEAQAMGKPVITSDLSPLKEVSGTGAALVEPTDYLSIRKGLLKIIEDETYRESVIKLGKENVKRFDSQAITALYEDVYQEITDNTVKVPADA